ncbi:hypothetical protein BKA61DRAFT_659323 [Leptodontidium sp. MPI-SDFR-AT-0119]|nr:hypothetical protein BKA61DRAFT_659323 [Leptodontidium sp. MPI-SDFR-AT-0119]
MRLSTISLSVLALLIRAAAAQDSGVDTINTIVPIEDNLPSTVPIVDPPAATSTPPFIDPVIDPLPTSVPVDSEDSSAVPEITTSPAPPQPMTTLAKIPEEKTTATSTTSAAELAVQSSMVMPPPESTKTLFSTTVITEKPTAKPETSKASTQSTAAPSQSVVPYVTGDANVLGKSIQCTALALMGALGVFMFA